MNNNKMSDFILSFAFPSTSTSTKVFCVDMSGSTSGQPRYHEISRKLYNELQKYLTQIIVIGWDDKFKFLSESEYYTIVSKKAGFGGTRTSAIASGLMALPPGNIDIIILSDGDVDIADISHCDKIMQSVLLRHNITSVTSYVSNNCTANCSVFAPFLRGKWSTMVFHDSPKHSVPLSVHSIDIKERQELIDLVKLATTEDQINVIYDRVVALLTAMTMGKREGDPQMRSIILDMFKRIKNNIKTNLSQNSILKNIEDEFFSTKNISVESVRNLMSWYELTFNGTTFQSKIDFLLRMCDGKLSNLFNPQQIRTASLARATSSVAPQTDEQLAQIIQFAQIIPSDTVTPIQCPIMLDDSSNMVVMIKQFTPLFLEIDKSMQDAIMLNTFFAMSLVKSLVKFLDHSISLEAYLSLPNQYESPMTRSQLCGCIVLGADDTSVKATNHTIGQMVLGKSGIIGNPDIWFYVLYYCIKSGNAPWLDTVLPMFENQLRYRMMHSGCTISMSGLAPHVQLKTKFGVALRFVLSQVEIGMKKEHSSFPIFSGSIQHIITLLKMFGCNLPDKLQKYCTVVHQLGQLVEEVKRMHMIPFKTKYRALIGNFYQIERAKLSPIILETADRGGWFINYVPIDGPQTTLPDFALNMTDDIRNLTYNLVQLIVNGGTESTSTFTIIDSYVKYDDIDVLFQQPSPLENDWKLFQYPYKYFETIIIHPMTLRPITFSDNIHWKKCYNNIFNTDTHFTGTIFDSTSDNRPSREVFSGNSMYGAFVKTYCIHPTLDDFVLYCYTRCNNSQHKHTTIPFVEFCSNIISCYNFTRSMPIDEFVSKFDASQNRDNRIKIEMA